MAKKPSIKAQQRYEAQKISIDVPGQGVQNKTVGEALAQAQQLAQQQQFGQSAKLAMVVAAQVPKYTLPLNIAADCFIASDDHSAAQAAITAALALDEQSWQALRAQASLYRQLDRYDEALKTLKKAVQLHPRNYVLLENLGNLYSERGNYTKAERCYRAGIKSAGIPASALRLLTDLPGGSLSSAEVGLAKKLLQGGEASAEQARDLHFALAQHYEALGLINEQMPHLHQANQLERARHQYHPDRERYYLQRIREVCTPELLQEVAGKDTENADDKIVGEGLIFIAGMPRSGSTLTEQILSCHPAVSPAGESNGVMLALRAQFPDKDWVTAVTELFAAPEPARLESMREHYLSYVGRYRHSDYVTDKTLGNYLLLGLIRLLFPGASIVHTYRHPIDNCFGCYKRLLDGTAWVFAYKLEELAIAYQCYQNIMRHWHSLMPTIIYDLQYEELVAEQERITRELLAHCGLPWDEQCLDFASNTRAVRTNSAAQVRAGLNTTAVGRWERYREHIGPLLDLQPFSAEDLK